MLSCDGKSMTLAWKSPKHCGGSKVNAYYIDMRDANTLDWKEVNLAPVKERICKVDKLTEGTFYEFKIQAANLAGVGVPSAPSTPMKCEAWNMEEPGPAYDLSFSEVRGDSLVVLWKAPVYTGASAVTGYFVDMAKKGSSEFITLNQEATGHRYLQVSGLQEGESYVFRVRAVNTKAVGKPSQLSEPVCAKPLPGTKEIVCGVDEETGDIFLSLEACEISETSTFVWSKNYKPIGDCPRVSVSAKGRTIMLRIEAAQPEVRGHIFLVFIGTKEIVCGVDEETGDIFLSLEACEISETSTFVWSKNYKPIGDCPRVSVSAKGRTIMLRIEAAQPEVRGHIFLVFIGTKEIVCGVDEETGDIFLSLEACEISETSTFVWSKNYKPIGDCPRVSVSAKGRT
ncbi:hypothetical protein LDENG_00219170 [Lucifuga dentata]|nr:hypothetical protein LDENG_00219170 [Lucifuga dentata]